MARPVPIVGLVWNEFHGRERGQAQEGGEDKKDDGRPFPTHIKGERGQAAWGIRVNRRGVLVGLAHGATTKGSSPTPWLALISLRVTMIAVAPSAFLISIRPGIQMSG